MGCGKTSVGQALAFQLRWEFLDTDAMIERRQGISIPEIFAEQGEGAFRRMEEETARMLGKRKNAVISTGGGFLTREATVQALRENSGGFEAVVLLDCSFETCYQRIKNSDRPLVRNNTREQLEQIFCQRQEQYRRAADFVISNEDFVSRTVEKILSTVPIL